ncbi:hypothetical protein RHS01_11360 [Rhizoctonia solani]|uniref:Retrotransposon gag domain-containing protein n=1 Tax=Rhizoctonia solani TaxID=456999 RepID=A0A8H7I3I4_9AGAM|nr:hypothetical protein RHS01_11360 [Rhizoctonia solani]
MATRSRTASQAQSLFNQGYMEPALPPTTSVEYGKVSLEQVTQLLLGQVKQLKQEITEIKEAGIETWTNVENISQTVDVIKDGLKSLQLHGPRTPEGPQPKAVEETPHPYQKPSLLDWQNRSKAKQWLTRMLAWTRLNSWMFPTNQEVLSFLLMNMKDSAGAWAHPHLDQLGSHQAIIQTVEGFKLEFLAAFSNPDATRAAKWKITTLTQSSTCADYITKFRTLAMELDWNNAALRGQFAHGLHWELQNAALVIDNALRKERASHPPRDNKSSKQSNPARGMSTGQSSTSPKKLSNNPNFVLEKERNCCCAAGACIKCSKMGHKFAECRMGWKATPVKDKGKAKETAKIGKDSEYQLGKE